MSRINVILGVMNGGRFPYETRNLKTGRKTNLMITPNDAVQFLRQNSSIPQNVQLGINRYARQLVVPRGDAAAEKYRRQHVKFYPDAPATYVTFQMFVDTHGLGGALLSFAKDLATKRAANRRSAELQAAKLKAEKERSKLREGRRKGSLGSVILAIKTDKKSEDKRVAKIVSVGKSMVRSGLTPLGRRFTQQEGSTEGNSPVSICPLHPVKDAQNKVIAKGVLDALLVRSGYIVTRQPTEAGVIIVSDNLEKDKGAYRRYGSKVVHGWSEFVRKFGFSVSAWDTATSRAGAYAIDDIIADDVAELIHPEAESGMSVGAFELDGDDADGIEDRFDVEVDVDEGSGAAAGGGGGGLGGGDPMDVSEVSVGGRRRKTSRRKRGRRPSVGAKKPTKKKSSARAKGVFPQFVKRFAASHKGDYGNGPGQKPQTQMMKDAAKAWKKHKASKGM